MEEKKIPYVEEEYDVVVVGAGLPDARQRWRVQDSDWKQLFLP